MDPSLLIPKAIPIPVEWGWFYLFQVLTFIAHMLVMNVMLGVSVIAFVHHLRGKAETHPLTFDIAQKLPFTIAIAVNFGVAPLLFLQVLYGQFLYTSSVLMAVFWLLVVALVIVAYGSAYYYDFQYKSLGAMRTFFIGLTALCLLCVAFIFTNNMTLMLSPDHWTRYFTNPSGTLLNLNDPMVLPRYLHIVVSAIALGGLFIAIVWYRKREENPEAAQKWIRYGTAWFAYPSMLQYAMGMWFLTAMPPRVSALILGGSMMHTLVFALGAITGIYSIATALQQRIKVTTFLAVLTIILMVLLRDMVRSAYLAPYFAMSNREVLGDYTPLVLFVITLVAGLAMIAWMLKTASEVKKEVRS